jgi:hypothetical protein
MTQLITKMSTAVKTQVKWHQMNEIDRRIIRAQREFVESYSNWQSLVAARDAERKACEEAHLMVKELYAKYGMIEA